METPPWSHNPILHTLPSAPCSDPITRQEMPWLAELGGLVVLCSVHPEVALEAASCEGSPRLKRDQPILGCDFSIWEQRMHLEDHMPLWKMPKVDSTDSVGWERDMWLTKKRKVPNGTISVGTIKMCTCWKQAERTYLKTLTPGWQGEGWVPSLAFSL